MPRSTVRKRTGWIGKVVLITGASSGIGQALAETLADRGARVALLARRKERLETIQSDIEARGEEALALQGDVRSAADLTGAVDGIRNRWGSVDVLIANAGIGSESRFGEVDPGVVKHTFDVNVQGAVNAVGAVLPDMIGRGTGWLVGVSSLAGWRGLPGSSAYSASKAALTTFFEGLRVDLGPQGIGVTVVHPGFVSTEMTAGHQYPLPFVMPAGRAAEIICRGVEKGRSKIAFPWQMALLMGALKRLPDSLYDRVVRLGDPHRQ